MRTSRQFATTQHDVRADFLYGDGTGRYGASQLAKARRHPCLARDDLAWRETTFGNVKADVLADKDPSLRSENFCRVIRASAWQSRRNSEGA